MENCRNLEKYLAGGLKGSSLSSFERHLDTCSICKEEIDKWEKIKGHIEDWSKSFELKRPTGAEAAKLMMGLRPMRSRTFKVKPVVITAAAASIVCAFVLYTAIGNNAAVLRPAKASLAANIDHPIRVIYSEQLEIPTREQKLSKRLVVPGEGKLIFELGKDRIGLSSRSEIEILESRGEETRIRLNRGEIAVEAEHRNGNGRFSILAKDYVVNIVGTKLNVSMAGQYELAVLVAEGEVVVADPGKSIHKVKAEQVLLLDGKDTFSYIALDPKQRETIASMLEPPNSKVANNSFDEDPLPNSKQLDIKAKKPFSNTVNNLDSWRTLILNEQYQQAELALNEHLKKYPGDAEALGLLAGCLRKSGKWSQAVDVYKRIIHNGEWSNASAARFEAAALLQDKLGKPDQAAELLSDYLDKTPLLEAEAMLRLAKAWLTIGKKQEAKKLLMRIKQLHSNTNAAIEATDLLQHNVFDN